MILGIIFWLLVIYELFVFISNIAKRGSGPTGKEETRWTVHITTGILALVETLTLHIRRWIR